MRDDIRAKIAAHIRDHGQYLVCVGTSADSPPDFQPFVYTIGNHESGMTELLFIGNSGDTQRLILNILGKVQRDRGRAFHHGEIVDFTARLPAKLIDAGRAGHDAYAVQAGVYYGADKFELRQVLMPDQNGRYPGDPECLPPYSRQLVLTATH